jgi:hypothetical protein
MSTAAAAAAKSAAAVAAAAAAAVGAGTDRITITQFSRSITCVGEKTISNAVLTPGALF